MWCLAKFSCGTYVIVVFNSYIVVFLNMRNFFCDWLGDFKYGFVEFVDFSLRCYCVRDTPSSSSIVFFFAHAYTFATRPALIL